MNHLKEEHKEYMELQKAQNITNNNSNNINNINNTTNNTINIHINNDIKSMKEILTGLDNTKFLSLFTELNRNEFKELQLWNENEMKKRFKNNLLQLTMNNKIKNKSIKNIKMTDTDKKYNRIQIRENEEKNDFKSYNSDNVLSELLEGNIKEINEEHRKRQENDLDYFIKMDSIDNSVEQSFKQGYTYNTKRIIEEIIEGGKLMIDKIKNGLKFDIDDKNIYPQYEIIFTELNKGLIEMKNNIIRITS